MSAQPGQTGRSGRRGVWAAGLIVAAGAGVATAHGLYQVAAASRVPTPIGWLYPLITDGLALVAYAATSRLAHAGRRYAWGIVVLAAGLSGLAQAVYLAGGIADTSTAPVALRGGVGAWPAAAAALTAHLLHLISTGHDQARGTAGSGTATLTSTSLFHKPDPARGLASSGRSAEGDLVSQRPIGPQSPSESFTLSAPAELKPFVKQAPTRQETTAAASNADGVQPYGPSRVQPYSPPADQGLVQPPRTTTELGEAAVQPGRSTDTDPGPGADPNRGRFGSSGGAAPARERARHEASRHYSRHGALPTVTELMELAQVARGTAGTVLKDLRDNRPSLHIVNADTSKDTDQ